MLLAEIEEIIIFDVSMLRRFDGESRITNSGSNNDGVDDDVVYLHIFLKASFAIILIVPLLDTKQSLHVCQIKCVCLLCNYKKYFDH